MVDMQVEVRGLREVLGDYAHTHLVASTDGSWLFHIAQGHYVVVSIEDDDWPDWTLTLLPAMVAWGATFESCGDALITHLRKK